MIRKRRGKGVVTSIKAKGQAYEIEAQINEKKLLVLDMFLKGDDDNIGIKKELDTDNKRMDNMDNKLNGILKLSNKD